jgi:hypothetical protein
VRRGFLVAAGFVLLLAGCGHGGGATTTVPQQDAMSVLSHPVKGEVKVFFCTGVATCSTSATPEEEQAVGAWLTRKACIDRVVFVSKDMALRFMRRSEPLVFRHAPPGANPLPDTYVVLPKNASCTDTIVSDLKAARLRGVASIQPYPAPI